MLATHLFSKNIRSQITLPYQWLNSIVNVARLNSSSSSSSSSSDSSSDSDTESSNQNIGRQSKKNAGLSNNLSTEKKRNVDYLHAKHEAHKKRQIQKHLTEAAQTLTEKNVDNKRSVVSTLLRDIANIRNKDNRSAINKIDEEKSMAESKHKGYRAKQKYVDENANQKIDEQYERERSTVSRLLLENLQNKRKDDNHEIVEKEHDSERHLSVIHMIRSQQKANINKLKPKHEQMEAKNDTKIEEKYDMRAEPSVIGSLKTRQSGGWATKREERRTIFRRQEDPFEYKDIFNNTFLESPAVPKLETWDACVKWELERLVTTYPKNAFEEMVNWTKEGKLWKFPIDNEQGMEKEHNVHFSKHVFLEQHLAEWCPNKGPIRHFMELVCVGLSKNPYMTIEEKYDHIMWYKDYFQGKGDLLQELGLLE